MIEQIVLGLCIGMSCAAAPIDWPHLKLTRMAAGLGEPVSIASAQDGSGRLFVAERTGKIRVLVNGELQAEPFLDISSKVEPDARFSYAFGILGLAFPPGYAAKQYFYVHYTPDHFTTVLSRFHVPPGSAVADPASEQVILTTELDYDGGPTAGPLQFGLDGYLYFSRNAVNNFQPQSLDNIYGKILRIDVESTTNGYVIPPDNPLMTNSAYRGEIWSWGLYYPHALSFDSATGDLYINEGLFMRCEINYQSGGRKGGIDYGTPNPEFAWNDPSATYERYGATPPILALTSDEVYFLTGYFCRDASSARMNGLYIMGGFHTGKLAALARDGTNWVRQDFPEVFAGDTVFGADESGRVYVAQYGGTVDRIEDSGKVRPPVLPPSGVIQTDVISLSSDSPGARIRYTTDGRDPSAGDPEFPSGQTITVSTGMTVKAQALRDDLLPSDISTATYTAFKAAYPVFVPGPGPVPNPSLITITSATPNAVIRYTTNGIQPTLSSPINKAPVVVPGDAVVYARAYRNGFQDSDLNGATYTWAIAEAPVSNPLSGPITNGTWITMSSSTPAAKIRYTLDGTEPVATSLKYTNAIRINGNTTVKAITFAKGY